MNDLVKKKMFTIAGFVMAFVFWFFDSSIHYFLYKEPQFEFVPSDFNELWMRAVIVLLIMLFGIFADFFTNKIMFKQKQLEVARIYSSMIHASHHVLNNLLDQMQLFKLEALNSKDFDRDVIKLYDNAMKEASDLIATLSKVGDITEGDMGASVDPKNISNSSNNSTPADEKNTRLKIKGGGDK